MASLAIDLRAQWASPIRHENDHEGYKYPEKPNEFIRETYSGPAIYRWRTQPASIPSARHISIYIGSTRSFPRRLQEELRASGQSEKRLQAKLEKARSDDQSVFLDLLKIHSLRIDFPNGVPSYHLSQQDLCDPFLRLALEYLLLSVARRNGHTILNEVADLREELARSELEQMQPARRREVARKAGLCGPRPAAHKRYKK